MPIYKIALGSFPTFLLFLNTPNSFSFFFLSVFHSIFFPPFFHIVLLTSPFFFPFFPSFFLPFFFFLFFLFLPPSFFPLLFFPIVFSLFFFIPFSLPPFYLVCPTNNLKCLATFEHGKTYCTGTPKTYLLENSPFEWLKRAFPK